MKYFSIILLITFLVLCVFLRSSNACRQLWFNLCVRHDECCSGNCWRGRVDWKYGVCKPDRQPDVQPGELPVERPDNPVGNPSSNDNGNSDSVEVPPSTGNNGGYNVRPSENPSRDNGNTYEVPPSETSSNRGNSEIGFGEDS